MSLLTAALSLLVFFVLSATASTRLTAAEVAWHDRPEDCWMIIDGHVYDVTAFIAAHPGGEAILRGCGKDASAFFAARDAAGGHSAGAWALLDGHRLGALGEEIALRGEPPPAPHPHALTADGPRAGLLPTAGMAPGRSLNLHVAHHLPTGTDQPARVLIQLGYAPTAWSEVVVSDVTGDGISGLEGRLRPLDQHRGRPLSAVVVAGGGVHRSAGAPAAYGALTLERALLDRRLMLRASSVAALAPAVQTAAGGGVEIRPIPIHGLFAEVLAPVFAADAGRLAWSAGARLYTRGHHFSVYASSTPTLSLGALGAPAEGMSIGLSFDRAFRL